MTSTALEIDYYTDLLCVWAWIAQRRVDELNEQFGSQVNLRYRYLNIFGDTEGKIQAQWAQRDGWSGYADHVQHSAEKFEHAPVHTDLWRTNRPTTSANAHLILKAVELANDEATSQAFALSLRRAFFTEALDISDLRVLLDLCEQCQLAAIHIQSQLDSGAAMAALMNDYQQANSDGIKGSPSFVLDNSRQTLYGNVGYRVLAANVEELLKNPSDEASWC